MDLVFVGLAFVPLEWVLCAFSVAFTVGHTVEEVVGDGGPFWDYYRRHFGHGISDVAGAILFTYLAAILIALAIGGYICGSAFLLGVLVGARFGDAVISHLAIGTSFPGPSPGLATSPIYLVEGVVALCVLPVSPLGFGLGWCGFLAFWIVSYLARKR